MAGKATVHGKHYETSRGGRAIIYHLNFRSRLPRIRERREIIRVRTRGGHDRLIILDGALILSSLTRGCNILQGLGNGSCLACRKVFLSRALLNNMGRKKYCVIQRHRCHLPWRNCILLNYRASRKNPRDRAFVPILENFLWEQWFGRR